MEIVPGTPSGGWFGSAGVGGVGNGRPEGAREGA